MELFETILLTSTCNLRKFSSGYLFKYAKNNANCSHFGSWNMHLMIDLQILPAGYRIYRIFTEVTEFLGTWRSFGLAGLFYIMLSTGPLLNHFCRNNRKNNHEGELLNRRKTFSIIGVFLEIFSSFFGRAIFINICRWLLLID